MCFSVWIECSWITASPFTATDAQGISPVAHITCNTYTLYGLRFSLALPLVQSLSLSITGNVARCYERKSDTFTELWLIYSPYTCCRQHAICPSAILPLSPPLFSDRHVLSWWAVAVVADCIGLQALRFSHPFQPQPPTLKLDHGRL